MIRLQSDTIHYLKDEVLAEFANLKLVSVYKESVAMNPLILAAVRSPLFKCLHEDDEEHVIITEFTKDELLNVVQFSRHGYCDNSDVLKAFGLGQDNLEESKRHGTLPVKVEIKEEYDQEDFKSKLTHLITKVHSCRLLTSLF